MCEMKNVLVMVALLAIPSQTMGQIGDTPEDIQNKYKYTEIVTDCVNSKNMTLAYTHGDLNVMVTYVDRRANLILYKSQFAIGDVQTEKLLRDNDNFLWLPLDKTTMANLRQIGSVGTVRISRNGRYLAATSDCGCMLCMVDLYNMSEESSEGRAIRVSARRIKADYEANEIAADRMHKGKTVKVTGKVEQIGRDIVGTPYVVLFTGGLGGVHCKVIDERQIISLRKGQVVTIEGVCCGTSLFSVVIGECRICD